MPRRRRRSRAGGLSAGGLVVLILSLLLAARREWPALAILWIFVLVLWVAFFKPTQCDVEKANGEGCGNPAHGRLRACHLVKHKRAKHDALWAMFKLKNPAIRYRIMWAQRRPGYGRVSPQPENTPEPKLTRPLYDATMAVSTILMLLLTAATSAQAFHLI